MIPRRDILRLSHRLAVEFQPQRVILFGSYAYGKPTPDSDVDLLVIMSFEGEAFWKSQEILNRLDPFFPVDIIVRRPEDVERRYALGDPLLREALDRGKVLHE